MGFLDIFKQKSPELAIDRSSKGTIRGSFYATHPKDKSMSADGQPSPENLNHFYELYEKDPIINAGFSTRADAILTNGYTTEGKKSVKAEGDRVLKKIGFDYDFLWQWTINGLVYEHTFVEIERTNNGQPAGLHILETPYMEIVHDQHGEIVEYVQQGENGVKIHFPVEDIIYTKFNELSSSVWGTVTLKSLLRSINTKNFLERFINSMAVNNDFRQVLKTTMSDENIEDFLAYYVAASANPNMPLVMQIQKGADITDTNTFETLRNPEDLKEFLGVLDYFRTQILMGIKVPPIMIGLPDSSNRSNSDAQIKAFHVANKSFQRKLTRGINELFTKLSLGNLEFSFNPIDKRDEKDDIEMAERLINMGADPDKIEEWLRKSGLELPEGKLFISPQQEKSEDMFDSRKRKAEGEMQEKVGSGEDSSTRQEQVE